MSAWRRTVGGAAAIGALVATLGFAAAAATPPRATPAAADRVVGLWLTEERDAHIRVVKAGDSYEGTIVWLREPLYPADDDGGMAGQPKVDRENPDPARHAAPIVGLRIVQGFRFRDDEWKDGTIYDPNNGKTYRCRMWFDGETLRVRGYIGISLLGRSTSWTRVAPVKSELEH
jgi:uncharacterized protein (DUF2147 family)